MSFDNIYKPIEEDELIEAIIDFPEGSLVILNEREEKDLKAMVETNTGIEEFLDYVSKRFEKYT